jgi:hypothetical protein
MWAASSNCGFGDERPRPQSAEREPVAADDDNDSGLVQLDSTRHRQANGKEWISFPAPSYENPNGGVSRAPVVEFAAGAKKARGIPATSA